MKLFSALVMLASAANQWLIRLAEHMRTTVKR